MKFSVRLASVVVITVLLAGTLCFGESSASSTKKSSGSSGKSKAGHHAKSARGTSRKGKHSKKVSWRNRQEKMEGDRVREVQSALIREHYLTGEPTGVWDQKSQNAMLKLQAENGWQTKIVPDSRALIKLGLGPSNDHLLNPETAITSPLHPASAMQHTAPVSTPISPTSAVPLDPVSTPQK